jgi:predicted 3-demethylubiquinone-9 3-methyltransferase (glyoxalase superfamily)
MGTKDKPKVRTCLWFDGNGKEAAEYYVSLLPGGAIEAVSRPDPDQPALVIELSLAGTPYMFLNGGPHSKLSPAASIVVRTADQADTDRLVWPSKEARETGMEKVMADERMKPENIPMPFDVKRVTYGGFEVLLDSGPQK